uniref:Uncharacterized protein n=1 Tax=Candidatus Methanophaga sp. ANME-1 ERB7 TaxID=2759913 RepID=A0A7G9Z5B9_9EURY|nr:hypothetical protein DEIOECNE_00003 [Methanosarcinales archaeon ANME-1 ERB7]
MMRKVIAILLILALGMLVTSSVAAKELEVQKIVDSNKEIKVGDGVSVQLDFKNPFNSAIPVQLVDKNVFGNNGLDIQCLEFTLPGAAESGIAYEPIVPYKPGMYTLDAAMVTYTNPDTGKEETVNSNTLDIMVEENKSMPSVQAEGITTIYRCGGTNIQSTSYSSSSSTNSQFSSSSSSSSKSFNIQFGGSTVSGGQPQSGSQQGLQKRVDNNQLNQNMEQLKKEMESELQKQQELEEQIQQELAKDPAFQKYAEQLTNAGFNSSPPSFNPISQNHTEITVPYRNESAEKKIKADYVNGTIQNVTLESTPEQKKEEGTILWWLLLLIIIALVIIGWFIYTKYIKKEPLQEPIPVVSKQIVVDYVTEARRMVEEAERLFSNSQEKDAYEKVSQALRFYFAQKFGIKKELLNTELITILSGKEDTNTYSDVKACLDLCGMVEFAKYKANTDDFGKIVTMAKAVII